MKVNDKDGESERGCGGEAGTEAVVDAKKDDRPLQTGIEAESLVRRCQCQCRSQSHIRALMVPPHRSDPPSKPSPSSSSAPTGINSPPGPLLQAQQQH